MCRVNHTSTFLIGCFDPCGFYENKRQEPDIDGLRMSAALEFEKISWTLKAKTVKHSHSLQLECFVHKGSVACKSFRWMVDFVLTFKFDVPQVLRKVMKCYFQPLVQLLCKFSDNLSQTVKRREIDFTIGRKKKKK